MMKNKRFVIGSSIILLTTLGISALFLTDADTEQVPSSSASGENAPSVTAPPVGEYFFRWIAYPAFDYLSPFNQGYAFAGMGPEGDRRMGMVNAYGMWIIDPVWNWIGGSWYFYGQSDTLPSFLTVSDGTHQGVLNFAGQEVLPVAYHTVSVSGNLARVGHDWQPVAAFDLNDGQWITAMSYEHMILIPDMEMIIASYVGEQNTTGLLRTDGSVVLDFTHDWVRVTLPDAHQPYGLITSRHWEAVTDGYVPVHRIMRGDGLLIRQFDDTQSTGVADIFVRPTRETGLFVPVLQVTLHPEGSNGLQQHPAFPTIDEPMLQEGRSLQEVYELGAINIVESMLGVRYDWVTIHEGYFVGRTVSPDASERTAALHDRLGNLLIPAGRYTDINPIGENLAVVSRFEGITAYDYWGNESPVQSFGVANTLTGEYVVPLTYSFIQHPGFSPGLDLAVVIQGTHENSRQGLINPFTGDVLVYPMFDQVQVFHNRFVLVADGGTWQDWQFVGSQRELIDLYTGQVILTGLDLASELPSGMLAVGTTDMTHYWPASVALWGIIGNDGEIVLPMAYNRIISLVDPRATIQDSWDGLIVVNQGGSIPPEIPVEELFFEGGQWGVMNTLGEWVMPLTDAFEAMRFGGANGQLLLARQNGRWGVGEISNLP